MTEPAKTTSRPATEEAAADVISAAWSEALGGVEIDRQTGFFDLGADSAILVEVVSVLRVQWRELRVVDLFAHPTVASLASFVSGNADRG